MSKLHDEIRMLREKLQQQQQRGGTEAEGSEVDEKTRSKLRDLEEAMKSTWEQKAQLSLQYEQVSHGYGCEDAVGKFSTIGTCAQMHFHMLTHVHIDTHPRTHTHIYTYTYWTPHLHSPGAHRPPARATVRSASPAGSQGAGLAAMSYDLHKELSDKYDGAKNWGYRTVETLVCLPSKR
ncbi:hypothetical protein EON65_44375 [archaeon]|nr:MAG: hypothetical protein EON65_44375 [archaeon]